MAAVTSRENTLYDNTEGILPGLHRAISSMFLNSGCIGHAKRKLRGWYWQEDKLILFFISFPGTCYSLYMTGCKHNIAM